MMGSLVVSSILVLVIVVLLSLAPPPPGDNSIPSLTTRPRIMRRSTVVARISHLNQPGAGWHYLLVIVATSSHHFSGLNG